MRNENTATFDQGGLVLTFSVAYSRYQKPRLSLQSLRACESKERVFRREGLRQVQEGRLGKTRDISRPPEIDVAAEAPDGLRGCERSCEVGDYRPCVDRVDASEALSPDSYERFHTREPSRSVKEQCPGFTGLVKRVDTVAETRVVPLV